MTPRLQAVEKHAGPGIPVSGNQGVGYGGYNHSGAAFGANSGAQSIYLATPTVYNAPSTPGTMVYQGNALVGMTR